MLNMVTSTVRLWMFGLLANELNSLSINRSAPIEKVQIFSGRDSNYVVLRMPRSVINALVQVYAIDTDFVLLALLF